MGRHLRLQTICNSNTETILFHLSEKTKDRFEKSDNKCKPGYIHGNKRDNS